MRLYTVSKSYRPSGGARAALAVAGTAAPVPTALTTAVIPAFFRNALRFKPSRCSIGPPRLADTTPVSRPSALNYWTRPALAASLVLTQNLPASHLRSAADSASLTTSPNGTSRKNAPRSAGTLRARRLARADDGRLAERSSDGWVRRAQRSRAG